MDESASDARIKRRAVVSAIFNVKKAVMPNDAVFSGGQGSVSGGKLKGHLCVKHLLSLRNQSGCGLENCSDGED